MKTVDTVNHVRATNTNLPTISILTDDGGIFQISADTYRERLRLTAQLLTDIAKHPSTARHQVASMSAVIRQLREDSETNLLAEVKEAQRIEAELLEIGWTKNPKGVWFDPSFTRQDVDTTLPLSIPIERTTTEQ